MGLTMGPPAHTPHMLTIWSPLLGPSLTQVTQMPPFPGSSGSPPPLHPLSVRLGPGPVSTAI